MSVVLELAAVVWTQGYSSEKILNVTNSGTENIESVKMKVTDSVVFDALYVYQGSSPYTIPGASCLNQFNDWSFVRFSGDNKLPAGATETIKITPNVKASAPIQVHNLNVDFQYQVY